MVRNKNDSKAAFNTTPIIQLTSPIRVGMVGDSASEGLATSNISSCNQYITT